MGSVARYAGISQSCRISIHAPRVGSVGQFCDGTEADRNISIHAPRVGSVVDQFIARKNRLSISIHAPRVGSVRCARSSAICLRYFNPRSPGGERQVRDWFKLQRHRISIHAPRVGSVRGFIRPLCILYKFQSTLPGWGASLRIPAGNAYDVFQSTLPGWGASRPKIPTAPPRTNFNPRSPGGERHMTMLPTLTQIHFNPRSPGGERPSGLNGLQFVSGISIHAPRVGSVCVLGCCCCATSHFNPRSPGGERHTPVKIDSVTFVFQSTLPGWGASAKKPKFAFLFCSL